MTRAAALFLDRDGVINVDHGYVHRPEDCHFIPGIFELARRARAAGLLVLVVTNQAGIARGYFSEAQFASFTRWMEGRFKEHGAILARTYYCPHHPEAGLGVLKRICNCRKPEPGMLLQAAADFGLDLAASWMVGDKPSDMQAALAAGVGQRILLSDAPPTAPENTGAFIRVNRLDDILLAYRPLSAGSGF